MHMMELAPNTHMTTSAINFCACFRLSRCHLYRTTALQAVRRVGEQLVSAADSGEGGAAFRHTHGLKLEYAVIDSDNMNAGVTA